MSGLRRNMELEAAVVAAQDDWHRFAVYGDWLEQHDDPRGALMVAGAELAGLERRGDDKTARATELRHVLAKLWRERRALLERDLEPWTRQGLSLSWRLGCVREATMAVPPDATGAEAVAALVAHPASFALHSLAVRTVTLGTDGFSYQPIVDVVSERAPLTLRTLSLGELDGWTEDETVSLGDLRPLYGRHRRLQEVTLAGRPSTVNAPSLLPHLRRMTLRPVGLSRTWLRVVAAETWPELTELTFSYVSAFDADVEWLRSSRLPSRMPKLRRLAVIGSGNAELVIELLAATGLGAQLSELDVTWGQFRVPTAELLHEERASFPALRRLVVQPRSFEVEAVRERLSWLEIVPPPH